MKEKSALSCVAKPAKAHVSFGNMAFAAPTLLFSAVVSYFCSASLIDHAKERTKQDKHTFLQNSLQESVNEILEAIQGLDLIIVDISASGSSSQGLVAIEAHSEQVEKIVLFDATCGYSLDALSRQSAARGHRQTRSYFLIVGNDAFFSAAVLSAFAERGGIMDDKTLEIASEHVVNEEYDLSLITAAKAQSLRLKELGLPIPFVVVDSGTKNSSQQGWELDLSTKKVEYVNEST